MMIVYNQGSVFILQVTKKMDKHLGIWLQLSTPYHLRINGESDIPIKAVEQLVHHFYPCYQDFWEILWLESKFKYKNDNQMSIGVALSKKDYKYKTTYGRIPSSKQCILVVRTQLKQLEELQ